MSSLEREIESKIQFEDFPKNFRRVVDIIGINAALKLIKNSGGINQYIPMYDNVIFPARDRLILEEFSGTNYQELALKYKVSEVWIRAIIDKDKREKHQENMKKNQSELNFTDAV